MSVELNFLRKEKRTGKPLYVILLIFGLLVIGAVATLFFQWNNVRPDVQSSEQLIQAKRMQLKDVQPDNHPVQESGEHDNSLLSAKQMAVPHVALYNQMVSSMNHAEQLQTFDYSGGSELRINADFASLGAVSDYTKSLRELPYIQAVDADNVSKVNDGTYNASIKIMIDENALRKELGDDAG